MRGASSTAWGVPSRLLPFFVLLLVSSTEARYLLTNALAQIQARTACHSQQDCAKTAPASAVLPSGLKALQGSSPAILLISQAADFPHQYGEFTGIANAHAHTLSPTQGKPRAPPTLL